jgi:Tol biopolymer transport system component
VPLVPAALDRLVRTCMAADPDERWQSARDVQLQLRVIGAEPTADAAPAMPDRRRGRWVPWAVTAAALVVAAAVTLRPARVVSRATTIRFLQPPPPGGAFYDNFENVPLSLAPDGSKMAFVAADAGGVRRIWVREWPAVDAQPVADTDGATSVTWSPDGRSVAFFAGGKLKRVDLPGGAAVTVCDFQGSGMSATWGQGGQILFATVGGEAIYRVPASGGSPVVELKPDATRGERRAVFPWFLPDGRRFVYSARLLDGMRVMLAAPGEAPRQILSVVSNVQYVDPGYLVYVREGTLVAQRFDAERAAVVGAPISIAASVRSFYSTSQGRFATASGGAIAYHTQLDRERMVWIDRTGRETGNVGAPGVFISMRISPDGGRVLFSRAQPQIGTFDLWLTDFERGGEQRLTSDVTSEVSGIWSRDGRVIVFAADRGGPPHLFRKDLSSGAETELLPSGGLQTADDTSPDGTVLVFSDRVAGAARLGTMRMDGTRQSSPLSGALVGASQVRFSPDGRLVAFSSNESGKSQVYVAAYPPTAEKTPVSTAGGSVPRWSRDGRELFFLGADRRFMAVMVTRSPSLTLSPAKPLFALTGRRTWKDYDVSPDGLRFLAIVTDVLGDEQPLTVVLNWTAALDR